MTFLLILLMNMNTTSQANKEIAVFGGGCFWCTEAIFKQLKGVYTVTPGYSGDDVKLANYNDVCSGETNHAEVIKVEYDPTVIQFEKLLEVFFKTHDPTSLNKQGADVGTQYRSVVFFINQKQKEQTDSIINVLNKSDIWENPIVTKLEKFDAFYPAETYHNNYFRNNPNQGYCRIVIQPKVEKFEKVFSNFLKK